MVAWETLLAAFGGLVLGLGLGMAGLRHRDTARQRALERVRARVRAWVIPLLEERAQTLGLPRDSRAYDREDPLEVAIALAETIQRQNDSQNLPFSDTVELARHELERKSG